MHSRSAEPPPGATGADHWVAAAFLCANKPKKTAGADVYAGTTIDQIIAQKIGQENLMPSMQLAVEDPGANSSNCGEGYSCTYTNTISWSLADPAPAHGAESAGGLRAHVRRRWHARRNAPRAGSGTAVFWIRSRAVCLAFAARPGASDRARLDDYTDNVREIERRLQIAMKASTVAPADMSGSGGRAANLRRAHQTPVRSAWRWPSRRTSPAWARCCLPATSPAALIPESEAPTAGFPWHLASWRRSEENRRVIENQPVSR